MPDLYGHLTPQGVLNGSLQTIVHADNYNDLTNKPSINSVELQGNKTAADLGLLTAGDIPVESVNGKQGVVELDGTDINYSLTKTLNQKIDEVAASIPVVSYPVTSVNTKTGAVELDGTDINYSLTKTLNQKIDEVAASIPVVSYPVTSVNTKTGAVVLDDTDIEHSSGVSVNSLINTIMNYTPVYGNTASGAIATFDTSLALPLQDCTIEINAVQEGSGTPSPDNVRPITGFSSVNIKHCGKNFLPFPYRQMDGTYGTITMSTDSTGKIHLSGTNGNSTTYIFLYGSSSEPIPRWIRGGVKYSLYPSVQANKYFTQMILYGSPSFTITGGDALTLPDDLSGYTGFAIVVGIYANAVLDDDVYPMITEGSYNSSEPFEAYTGTTYPVSLGQTVYGGSLDVTTGELTITRGYRTVTSNDTIRLFGSLNSNTVRAGVVTSDMKMPTWNNTSEELDIICNIATPNTDALHASVNAVEGQCCLYKDGSYPLAVFTLPSSCSTINLALTELVNNGCEYCYPLANPITVQLTPTQIRAIVGTNNVFTDTNGDTSVVYACSLKDYIDSQ